MTNNQCLRQVITTRCPDDKIKEVNEAIERMVAEVMRDYPKSQQLSAIEKELAYMLVDGLRYGNWPGVRFNV